VTFRLVNEPGDRPAFQAEALRVIAARIAEGRDRLLAKVATASDEQLASGTDDDWGLGQIAAHLLVVERGISGIALRLAKGEPAGETGQPRPAVGSVTREKISELADRAKDRLAKLLAEFPAHPDISATARQPYYGDLNCWGWLLAVPIHYAAHLDAVERGKKSTM